MQGLLQNPHHGRKKAHLSCPVYVIAVDDLVMKGAKGTKALVAMILTWLTGKILILAQESLTLEKPMIQKQCIIMQQHMARPMICQATSCNNVIMNLHNIISSPWVLWHWSAWGQLVSVQSTRLAGWVCSKFNWQNENQFQWTHSKSVFVLIYHLNNKWKGWPSVAKWHHLTSYILIINVSGNG